MIRASYSTDLTDAQWQIAEPVVATSDYGRPPLPTKRELLNAIFYQLRAGYAQELLPHDLPPWRTVYKQFEAQRKDGTWDKLLDALRRQVRQRTREAEPIARAIDTQYVRTGSKRGAVTATMPASEQLAVNAILWSTRRAYPWPCWCRRPGAGPVRAASVLAEAKARTPQLQLLWADARYQGSLVATVAAALGLRVEVVRTPPGTKGFVVLPRRWVAERTFGWLSRYRRVAGHDYETNPLNSEAIIKACFCHLMLHQLIKVKPSA